MSSNELLRVIHEVNDQLVLLDVKNKDFEEELILAQAKRQGLTIQMRTSKETLFIKIIFMKISNRFCQCHRIFQRQNFNLMCYN